MVAKTQASIQGLRRANQATARLLQELSRMARPGMTTRELDDFAMSYITQLGAIPVFRTEEGFPGCINTSINDAAVHGVPGNQKLKIGDILSIDAGMILDGYCGDATITIAIAKVNPQHQYLIDTTHEVASSFLYGQKHQPILFASSNVLKESIHSSLFSPDSPIQMGTLYLSRKSRYSWMAPLFTSIQYL